MEGNTELTFGSFLLGEFAQKYSAKDRNLFDAMDYTSSNTSDNQTNSNSTSQNSNNNSNKAEGETSGTSSSTNRISQSANSTLAPNSGVEVSEFHSIEDISISRTNSQTDTRENYNSNEETTVLNNTAIQTDFPQISVPFPQRNKREREYATAKPNKFRKIDSH